MPVMWVMEPISCYLLVGFNGQCPVSLLRNLLTGQGSGLGSSLIWIYFTV